MKPILFNTEMVRAILDGRKTQTRRVVKPQPQSYSFDGRVYIFDEGELPKPSYQPGDILYVRETWCKVPGLPPYLYKASCYDGVTRKWHPSIHMPKNAARLFLRVTDVRVERLWDMQPTDICAEGVCVGANDSADAAYKSFSELWDSTIKPADRDRCDWIANPWVWVYTFERCGKEGESWNG